MSEMALTADHLVIIGRGRLLADTTTERFVASSGHHDVLVRSPKATDLAPLLVGRGATVNGEGDALIVAGMDAAGIADLASEHGIAIHELVPRNASLEQAYLDLTGESVEYHTGVPSMRGAVDR
jgi:ABC-2 type transport system ATP-binding protein